MKGKVHCGKRIHWSGLLDQWSIAAMHAHANTCVLKTQNEQLKADRRCLSYCCVQRPMEAAAFRCSHVSNVGADLTLSLVFCLHPYQQWKMKEASEFFNWRENTLPLNSCDSASAWSRSTRGRRQIDFARLPLPYLYLHHPPVSTLSDSLHRFLLFFLSRLAHAPPPASIKLCKAGLGSLACLLTP